MTQLVCNDQMACTNNSPIFPTYSPESVNLHTYTPSTTNKGRYLETISEETQEKHMNEFIGFPEMLDMASRKIASENHSQNQQFIESVDETSKSCSEPNKSNESFNIFHCKKHLNAIDILNTCGSKKIFSEDYKQIQIEEVLIQEDDLKMSMQEINNETVPLGLSHRTIFK